MLKMRSELGRTERDDIPAVVLFTGPGVPGQIAESVLQGMEEESIPALWEETQSLDAVSAAHQAAGASRLDVGVAILADPFRVVLHQRELPTASPLDVLQGEGIDKDHLRMLGANAARLVKGDPLLEEIPDYSFSPESESQEGFRQEPLRPDHVEFLVSRVLELLAVQQR